MGIGERSATETITLRAQDAPARDKPSNYPPEFAARMAGRTKRPLGDLFGIRSFGVNHVTLEPGAISALHHRHSLQDEFVIVLSGQITLVHDGGEEAMASGDCVGFPREGPAHHLHNRSQSAATYLEVGDRRPGDGVSYPADDLQAVLTESGWRFARKSGEPY
jgi:uncharacterized cupin superfamily protein